MGLRSGVRFHVRDKDVFYTMTFVLETRASSYTLDPHGVRGRAVLPERRLSAAQSDLLVFRFRMREVLTPHSMLRSLNTKAAFPYNNSL